MAMARMDDIRDETPPGEITGSQPAGSADKGPRSVGPERETRGGPKAPDTTPDEAERQRAVPRQASNPLLLLVTAWQIGFNGLKNLPSGTPRRRPLVSVKLI